MSWQHIVTEGFCSFDINKLSQVLPKNCIIEPNHLGTHCLSYSENSNLRRTFLGYTSSPSSIVLTGQNGIDIACDEFYTNETLTTSDWLKQANMWIEKWKKKNNHKITIK